MLQQIFYKVCEKQFQVACFKCLVTPKKVQTNLYMTTTLRTTQKWLPWAGAHLTKHPHKTTT